MYVCNAILMHYILIHYPKSASVITRPKPMNTTRLRLRYLNLPPTAKTDWLKHAVTSYVELAIVKKESGAQNKNIIKHTVNGDIDRILKMKEPLADLRDIFHDRNKPCPRLIVITGGPGEY